MTLGCAPSWAEVDAACARLLAADHDTVGALSTHELRELAFERYVDEQRAALAGARARAGGRAAGAHGDVVSEDQIAKLLEALGDTEDQVARTLLAAGHRGVRGNACVCPVAKYLAANGIRVGTDEGEAAVDEDQVRIHSEDGGFGEFVDLQPNVQLFISSFDAGRYPDLELPSVTP